MNESVWIEDCRVVDVIRERRVETKVGSGGYRTLNVRLISPDVICIRKLRSTS